MLEGIVPTGPGNSDVSRLWFSEHVLAASFEIFTNDAIRCDGESFIGRLRSFPGHTFFSKFCFAICGQQLNLFNSRY